MTTLGDAAQRWLDVVLGATNRSYLQSTNLHFDGNRAFSWGSWWEISRPVYRGKKLECFLLNGDERSHSTRRHTNEVRSVLERAAVRIVTIPYSVLDAAGIDRDSIQVLELVNDYSEEIRHAQWRFPERGRWHTEGIYEDRVRPREEALRLAQPHPFYRNKPYEQLDRWLTHKTVQVGTKKVLRVGWNDVTVEHFGDETRYSWTEHRHHLGEALVRARVDWWDSAAGRSRYRWATFLSGFDENEPGWAYFFCELPPRSKAKTIAEAREVLRPDAVKLAEQMGRDVIRQGDIFCIPLSPRVDKRALRKQGAAFERMGFLLNTNHVATDVARLPDGTTLARGILWHKPLRRAPDHVRVQLGTDRWYAVCKNTVPIAA